MTKNLEVPTSEEEAEANRASLTASKTAWKKSGVHRGVVCPSGTVISVRLPNLAELAEADAIPNELVDIATAAGQLRWWSPRSSQRTCATCRPRTSLSSSRSPTASAMLTPSETRLPGSTNWRSMPRFVKSTTAMRLLWTHKELGQPLQISSDEVVNWCIMEALLTRRAKEQEEAEEKRRKREEREAFKRDPKFKQGA